MTDLIKRDPIHSMFAWPRWMSDWEDEFPTVTSSRGMRIHDDEKNIYVDAVVAGVPAEDVDVDIEDGVVTVKAESKKEEKKKDEYRSSAYNYYYTCALSGGQWDKAEAEVNNGVLELKIPKTEASRPRKVSVKAKASKK